jgi:hypothetical protein
MTTQPNHLSAIEAATQAAVGLPVGWAVCFSVELLGLSAAASAALITIIMFLFSTIRGYIVRRSFDKVSRNG